jgi:4-amino-4-deoxy-L-arabinose transferase-like glycosyltransferase
VARALVALLVGAVLLVGVLLRFLTQSDLWLDEALSANIAGLPLDEIPDALRRDGFPPLFYWLLHLWTAVVGEGDVAVRAMSGLASVAALPVAWVAGRRLGGREAAWAATLLVATSPFAVHYATEARMYSLLALLALLGYLAVARALERPSPGRLLAVAAVTGGLVLLHYWALYLVAAVLFALAVQAVRHRDPAVVRVLLAVGVGSLALAPWLGVLRYQLEHTGTPWATGTNPLTALEGSVSTWGGGGVVGRVLGVLLVGLAVWAVVRRPQVRVVAAVVAGTLVLGVVVAAVSSSAFQPRYTAAVVPLFATLAGVGLAAVPDRRAAAGLLVAVVALGLVGALRETRFERTQAGEVAEVIDAGFAPGDVVAYCPDQLGPAVSRGLPDGLAQEPFPLRDDPRFVNWVDYGERNEDADPEAFVDDLLTETEGRIWYVWTPGYRTYGTACEDMVELFRATGRPSTTVVARRVTVDEDAELIRYDPPPVAAA